MFKRTSTKLKPLSDVHESDLEAAKTFLLGKKKLCFILRRELADTVMNI